MNNNQDFNCYGGDILNDFLRDRNNVRIPRVIVHTLKSES